jgi:hypothetical protein
MKKLKLDLDAMTVESFATMAESRADGTVVGFITAFSECGGYFCSTNCPPTYDPHCETGAVTCEYGPTMNPVDSECMNASMAGATCNGADTCWNTCG